MKNFSKYIIGFLGFMIIFSGCQFTDNQTEESLSAVNGETIKIYFNCITTEEASGARKAYANIDFNSYSYDLYAKENAAEEYSKLNNEKLDYKAIYSGTEISPKTYSFQLNAYDEKNNAVMTGTTDFINLALGYKYVNFVMRPQTGFTGSAKITVDFPDNASIAKIETCLTTVEAPFTPTQDHAQTITSFEVSPKYNGFKQINLNYNDLPSGKDVFAYIRIFDNANKVISSRLEAIEITGSATSESNIYIEKLRTYTVSFPLKKDGLSGAFPGKEIVLRDREGNEYVLTDDGYGNFTGSVADGEYDILMRDKGLPGTSIDTGIDFVVGSDSNQDEINYITVELPGDSGLYYTPVEGGGFPVPLDSNGKHEKNDNGNYEFLVPAGGKLTVNVGYEEGFNGNGEVTIGGNSVVPAATGVVPQQPTNTLVINIPSDGTSPDTTVNGVTSVSYTITYIPGQYKFRDGYTPPVSYTALKSVELPKYTDVEYLAETGFMLDGWQNITDTSKVYADIPKGMSGNIELKPVWKKGVNVSQPVDWNEEHPVIPGNFTVAPSVFACGYSLIIKWSDDANGSGETNIFIDYNSNGIIDADEPQVTGSYNPSVTDFTGYKLKAENADGTKPASNFTYTVLGGKLASMTGLGHDAQNTSIVNISGKNTVIGNGVDVGIDLPSLTNEWVNINDQMSGNYHITLETRHEFNKNEKTHKVAYIQNSAYAQTSKFTCIKQDTKKELGLGFSNITENGINKIIIYLKDPSPIHLPSDEEVKDGGLEVLVWDAKDNSIPMEFRLGNTALINEKCSVFSVSVKNGRFQLKNTKIKKEDGSDLTTLNLGQTGPLSYSETLATNTDYLYLHMFSQDNMITPARATEFLRSICFIRDSADKEIVITLNLEAVPYSEISSMQSKYGATKFNYFDGSFYLGIKLANNATITWNDSYNLAKQQVFNGMNGYLINITSEVENNYIFKRMNLGQCWTGGARYDERTIYDTSTIAAPSAVTLDTAFKWQSGPEAGVIYTDGTIPLKSGSYTVKSGVYSSGTYTSKSKNYYMTVTNDVSALANSNVNFYNSEWTKIGTGKALAYDPGKKQLTLSSAPSMSSKGLFSKYSTSEIAYVAATDIVIESVGVQDSGNGKYKANYWAEYTHWDGGEPNDSNKGKSEQCMHFLSTGFWNDYSADYGSVYGYIVEFTPYENQWNKEKANYPSMKAQMNY